MFANMGWAWAILPAYFVFLACGYGAIPVALFTSFIVALRAQRPQQTPQPQAAQTPSAPLQTIPRFNSVPLVAKFTGIIVAAILSLLLVALFPWSAFFVSICIFGLLFLLWAENKAIKHK